MPYKQKILKPFDQTLISVGFTKLQNGVVITAPDRGNRRSKWEYSRNENVLYRRQIEDEFNHDIDIGVNGSDTAFELSIKLTVTSLSLERLVAILKDETFELTKRFIPTVILYLVPESAKMSFSEDNYDRDSLQVDGLINLINDVAMPFFRDHSTIASLLPDLKASQDDRTRYMTLPLALLLLKQPEEAFALLEKYEQIGQIPCVYFYENMSGKLKMKFPDLT